MEWEKEQLPPGEKACLLSLRFVCEHALTPEEVESDLTEFSRAWPLYLERHHGTGKTDILNDVCQAGVDRYLADHAHLAVVLAEPTSESSDDDDDDGAIAAMEMKLMEMKLAAMKAAKNKAKAAKKRDHGGAGKKGEAGTGPAAAPLQHPVVSTASEPPREAAADGKKTATAPAPGDVKGLGDQITQPDVPSDPIPSLLYTFSEDLPNGCELRIRAVPSTSGAVVGRRTAAEGPIKVFLERRVPVPSDAGGGGDDGATYETWLQVKIENCAEEAWMLQRTAGGMQLLDKSKTKTTTKLESGVAASAPAPAAVYQFSEELPQGCELRVRSQPTTTGEVLGLVTAVDTIRGLSEKKIGTSGGKHELWLKVAFCNQAEAWMLLRTADGMQLLLRNEPRLELPDGGLSGDGGVGPTPPVTVEVAATRAIFVFSDQLPEGCELRVRASPTTDGEVLGLVTSVDTIVGALNTTVKSDDGGTWLQVEYRIHENAWMLQCTATGMQLLERSDESVEDLPSPKRKLFEGPLPPRPPEGVENTDGTAETSPLLEAEPPEPAATSAATSAATATALFVAGQKIESRYMGGLYYPGTVQRVDHGTGTYDVLYDDGGFEGAVDGALIRGLGPAEPAQQQEEAASRLADTKKKEVEVKC
jgi:hypothetical protein